MISLLPVSPSLVAAVCCFSSSITTNCSRENFSHPNSLFIEAGKANNCAQFYCHVAPGKKGPQCHDANVCKNARPCDRSFV